MLREVVSEDGGPAFKPLVRPMLFLRLDIDPCYVSGCNAGGWITMRMDVVAS